MERSGTSTSAVYVVFSVFGNLTDPVVPTLRGASEDVVIVYAY